MHRSISDQRTITWLRDRIRELEEERHAIKGIAHYYRARAHRAEEALQHFRTNTSPDISPEISEESMEMIESEDSTDWEKQFREYQEYKRTTPLFMDSDDPPPTQYVPSLQQVIENDTYLSNNKNTFTNKMDCEHCGQTARNKCSQCGIMAYCSQSCQSAHWATSHQNMCISKSIEIPAHLLNQVYPGTREAFIRALNTDELYHIEGLREWWEERKAAFKGSEMALRAKWASPILGTRARRSAPDKVDTLANEGKWEKVLLYYRTAMKMENETKNRQRRKEYRAIWGRAKSELKSAPEDIQRKAFGLRKVVVE